MQGTIKQLAENFGMDVNTTRSFIRMLQRRGHVRIVSREDRSDRTEKRGAPTYVYRIPKTIKLV